MKKKSPVQERWLRCISYYLHANTYYCFLVLLVLLSLSTLPVFAQTKVITGTIKDAGNGDPVSGASILIKGKKTGKTTDAQGNFRIEASETDVLRISILGYKTTEVTPGTNNVLAIKLEATDKQLGEVIVVGYGTKKRSDLTGSVSSVPKERLSKLPVTNVLHAIEGAVAGVNVSQNSSAPGSSANVLVRGATSISSGTGPFVVLDGIPYSSTGGSINDINPNDIASIEILKDPSAVAIYGTRGANGVILITTKRGATGKPAIRYNVYAGLEDYAHKLQPMDPAQYVQKYADWKTQTGVVNNNPVPSVAEQANYAAGKTTDWLKEISQQGFIQNHNLSISGGTKDVKYYVSGDYLKQKGVIKGYQYNRASIRSNLDVNITEYLSAGVNLFFSGNNYDGGKANLTLASQMSPYGQLYNPNGTYYIFPMYTELLYTNPLLGTYVDRYDRSSNISGNVYAELKPAFAKALKYRINASYSYVPGRGSSYTGRNANDNLGTANVSNSETKTWVIENLLTYDKNWDKHHLDVTALYSAQQSDYFASSVTATGFINDLLSYNNIRAGATQSGSSDASRSNLLSQMLRINYSFNSRYLLSLTARRDGFSAYGANTNKYGSFPSAALAWNIANESFMKGITFIRQLKLRGSYGLAGNNGIRPYQTITTSSTNRLPYNGVSTIGVAASVLGNANLKWESTYGSNIGLDFSIWNDRISGTIETYSTKTKDLVLFRNLPTATGYTRILDNIGKVANKGIEVSLKSINVERRDFKWETMLNVASNKNSIVDLYGDKKDDIGNAWFIGHPINVIYDYELQGVWQTGEDASQQDPGVKPGDLKFADINSNKTITADDRKILGSPFPKWTGGITNTFRYKDFSLNIFIQTAQGILRNNSVLSNADQSGIINIPAEITYWTTANKSNTRPSIAYKNPRGYGYASDGSYTRLKDVTLSYNAPQHLLDKAKLGGLTLYVSGRNLITWTNWIGWDPENDYDRNDRSISGALAYPLVRSFVLGANITLR